MKKLTLSVLTLILLTSFSLIVLAEEDYMSTCKQYAKEEGVSAEEMDDYINDCVEALKSENESKPQD